MAIFLKTERLILRNLKQKDLECLYEYRNNEDCNRYQRYSVKEKQALANLIDLHETDLLLSTVPEQHYAIALKTGPIIGDLSVFHQEEENCITLGFTISYRFWKKGYAYELLSFLIPMIRTAFSELDIVCLVDPENQNSIRLLKKLGFQEEAYYEAIHSILFLTKADSDNKQQNA